MNVPAAPKTPWAGIAAPRYNKRRKRLSPQVQRGLNDVQAQILQDPYRGDTKRGAFKDMWVEKFQAERDQWLVAYRVNENARMVEFVDIGQHENFYRDLKRYQKTRQTEE